MGESVLLAVLWRVLGLFVGTSMSPVLHREEKFQSRSREMVEYFDFIAKEVFLMLWAGVKHCAPDKAPGPDGYTICYVNLEEFSHRNILRRGLMHHTQLLYLRRLGTES
ncbi:hypothetical protein H5410_015609 [Solanum commersonii]|uniref:Secreted protein n=1 Tax=Solanum commersonii TaxID=4109 RepID=A0A9J5ZU83_SOLCO|nr:hypothetical protein H5410_015609 [Solanum commersonii]